jgi:hypothetical protein
MRRLLATTMALGLVITAMNFTGIFAVFTDRATTGTNTEETGQQPRTADLLIAVDEFGNCTGATFSDNLETGLFDVSGLVPGGTADQVTSICLKNVGTATLTLTTSAIDVVETETACTGDEAAAGDATCGTAGVGDGELGLVLFTELGQKDCATGANIGDFVQSTVEDLAATPGDLGTIAPGAVACVFVDTILPAAGVLGNTSDGLQQAQTDKIEWRYAFDGTAS